MTDTTTAPTPGIPVKPPGKWTRRIQVITAVVMFSVFGLILIGKIITWGDLPKCDSTDTKNSLSSIFKSNKVELSRYNSITTLSSTKEEVKCNAILTKSAGGTLDIDYRLFFDDKAKKVEITRAEDKP